MENNIEKLSERWAEYELHEVINFNPRLSLPKGTIAKKIAMDALIPFTKQVSKFELEEFKGGTKFQNDDTILARITPCLENGKTAFINILHENEVAFGSTEYIVLREIEGISDSHFIYYLSISPKLREVAIQSMTGSSGRQRVQIDVLKNSVFKLPPLPEQKRIAHILGSLDDKIELNRQMNQTLEQMAQTLFKSWFVDFDPVIDNALAAGNPIPEELQAKAVKRKALGTDRKALPQDIQKLFPDEFEFSEELEKWVPKGWKVNSINKLVRSVSETYPLKSVDKVIFLNTGDILEGKFLHEEYSNTIGLPGQAKKSIQKGDILYSEIRPKNKRYAYVFFDSSEYVVSTKLMVLRSITDINSLFVYYFLKQEENVNQMQLLAESRSGTFPQITFDILSSLKIALPNNNDIVDYYTDNYLSTYYSKMLQLEKDNQNLTKLRDTLLPKLISGEVRVPQVKNVIE